MRKWAQTECSSRIELIGKELYRIFPKPINKYTVPKERSIFMRVEFNNCNNIDHGEITIETGRLNIKYAINGTGKSTIAHALEYTSTPDKLTSLTPYKYSGETPIAEPHRPSVICSESIDSVAIFNDSYVNQYLFQPNDLLANSFEILIKTADYDAQMEQIQNHMISIQETFQNNPELDELIKELSAFIAGFGKAQSGYSKTGSIGKGIAKGNKIEHIPTQLTAYTPFIQSEENVSWLSWQSKGEAFLDTADVCPFCAAALPAQQKNIVRQVATEYDSKYVAELQKMIGVFQSLSDYFTDEDNNNINQMATSASELTTTQINYLKEIKEQVNVLWQQLMKIRSFSYVTLKNVDAVVTALSREKIDLQLLSHINTEYTYSRISPLNEALDRVIEHAGQLQGAIRIQSANVRRTIADHTTNINNFLESAGYKYNVSIVENPEDGTYKLVLMSNDATAVVSDVKSHLSYGERNAFALVLFMYQTLRDKPDLMILDDPISSFDNNKKYAIMEMLFQGQGTLQGKNVIMLTHDFDPVVDLIHTSSIRCRFNPTPVASFLCNNNGQLTEKPIAPSDIKSFIEIADLNISGTADEINKLIYLRRKLEVLGDKRLAWQLLANVFHPNRETPIIQTEGAHREMTAAEIAAATTDIAQQIPGFDYARVYARAHDLSQMIPLYKTLRSNYERIQLYRIINHGNFSDTVLKKFVDEVYHIENDNLFQLNPAEYPTIPDYIIQLCNNHVDLMEAELL